MKSLLVDAIRQSKYGNPEEALSDSGSFDTTQSEIAETANDAVADETGGPDDELKLFETSASLDATFGESDNEAGFPGGDDLELGETPIDAIVGPRHTMRARTQSTHSAGPRVARFAPEICIVLAVLASASWFGFHYLKLKYAESEFAAAQMGLGSMPAAGAESADDKASVERFPFISPEPVK